MKRPCQTLSVEAGRARQEPILQGVMMVGSQLAFVNYFFFLKIYFIIYFMYVSSLLLSSDTPEEGIRFHYRWCESSPCGCWELNS